MVPLLGVQLRRIEVLLYRLPVKPVTAIVNQSSNQKRLKSNGKTENLEKEILTRREGRKLEGVSHSFRPRIDSQKVSSIWIHVGDGRRVIESLWSGGKITLGQLLSSAAINEKRNFQKEHEIERRRKRTRN